MSTLKDYITGNNGLIGILGAIVVITAFAVTANITAFAADSDNKDQDKKIEAMEETLHDLDKNVALLAQSAKRQEDVHRQQSQDMREVKQLLMEISRKQ